MLFSIVVPVQDVEKISGRMSGFHYEPGDGDRRRM